MASTVKLNETRPFNLKKTILLNSHHQKTTLTERPGLINLGNTCYANAVLQALLNSPLFKSFILGSWNSNKHINSKALNALRGLFDEYWHKKYIAIKPEEAVSAVQTGDRQFEPHKQQDSHEYLVKVLQMIHEETLAEQSVEKNEVGKLQLRLKLLEGFRTRMSHVISSPDRQAHAISNFLRTSAAENSSEKDVKQILNLLTQEINHQISDTQLKLSQLQNKAEVETKAEDIKAEIEIKAEDVKADKKQAEVEIKAEEIKKAEIEIKAEDIKAVVEIKAEDVKADKKQADENKAEVKIKADKIQADEDTKADEKQALKAEVEIKADENTKRTKKDLLRVIEGFTNTSHKQSVEKNSLIKDLTYGVLRSEVLCSECNRLSKSKNQFKTLSLEMPAEAAQSTDGVFGSLMNLAGFNLKSFPLNDCLKLFCGPTKENEMFFCSFCLKKAKGGRRYLFEKLPPLLCVQIRRFKKTRSGQTRKINHHVQFPLDDLDLSPFCDGSLIPNHQSEYTLSTVLVHEGKGMSGHYVSYCRHPELGTWNEFNDRFVRSASPEKVQKEQAYILFYEQKTTPQSLSEKIEFVEDTLKSRAEGEKERLLSLQWLRKVLEIENPGPLENRELLCKHSKRLTLTPESRSKISISVTFSQWERLSKRFGEFSEQILSFDSVNGDGNLKGGNSDFSEGENCDKCVKERLLRRKKCEQNTVLSLEENFELKGDSVTFIISEVWMNAWRCFVTNETDLDPGAIINETLIGSDGKVLLDNVIEKDFRVVSEEVWKYLHGIYGGGPQIVNDFLDEEKLVEK